MLVKKEEDIRITDTTCNKHEDWGASSLKTVIKAEEEDINPKTQLLSPAAKTEEAKGLNEECSSFHRFKVLNISQ